MEHRLVVVVVHRQLVEHRPLVVVVVGRQQVRVHIQLVKLEHN